MDIRRRLCLLIALLLPAWAWAQPEGEVALAPDHPQEYVVVRGDTLWDISGRFLEEPWLWPRLWRANPHIENPHLIYPGDVIRLEYRDGEPVLTLHRGPRPRVKLSPRVRVEERARAIPAIPLEAISPFLTESRVIPAGGLEDAPYVVSVGYRRLAVGPDARVYVRGLAGQDVNRYGLYREGRSFDDPRDGEPLGAEAIHVADLVMEKEGDPATFRVVRAEREVLPGDRLLPVESGEDLRPFVPREPTAPVDGSIVAVVDGVTQIGRNQVVILNVGHAHGVEAGHVLAVLQEGGEVADPYAPRPGRPPVPPDEHSFTRDLGHMLDLIGDGIGSLAPDRPPTVELPDERSGLVMVFRAFPEMSFALVMESTRAMHVLDRVTNP